MREIRLRDAKATLSAIVDKVAHGESAVITRYGKPTAAIVSFQEWQRLANVPSFGRLLVSAQIEAGDIPRRGRHGLRVAVL